MKKLLCFAAAAVLGFTTINAQDDDMSISSTPQFGVKAGFNSFIARATAQGTSASANASGFYVGVFGDFELSKEFSLLAELQYVGITEDGADGSVLVLPILAKYKVNEKFSLLAGPQLDYILDEDADGIKKFGLGLALGLAYDISDNIFLDTRYSFGLSNRLEDSEFDGVEVKSKFNYFQVGLGYKF